MCAATGTASDPRGWCITGCTLSAGGALQWCRDALFPGTAFEQLMAEARAVGEGSGGLVFLPYLTGERCPHPDPRARGAWVGLTARHTRGHLVRAVIEGVTFTMGQILDIVRGIGVPVGTVRLGGGGAKSELWRQMQADVYGARVAVTNTEEGPALGAAILAGVGAGQWGSVAAACAATIRETEVREPRRGGEYARAREVHAGLYADLKPSFAALGAIDA
jgi:xylulokinase